MEKIFSVKDVQEIDCSQTWTTKANATLRVLTTDPFPALFCPSSGFFLYDPGELQIAKGFEMRGLRTYTVRCQNPGVLGGTEFHRIRWEYVIGLEGRFEWTFEDLHGEKKVSVISPTNGILLPPFILHTSEAKVKNSGLLVICNTLYDPEKKETHDTYSKEMFRKAQKRLFN